MADTHVLRINKYHTNNILKILYSTNLIDRSRKIMKVDDNHVEIPVVSRINRIDNKSLIEMYHGEIVFGKCAITRKQVITPYMKILRIANIPNCYRKYLPSRWEMIGKVVILRLPNILNEYKKEIGKCYAKVLNAKTVVQIHGITGIYRIPDIEIIYGNDTETIHKENGILYKIDISKHMFSSGNIDERIRMAGISNGNETVVDMFAGIGYFTLPIAKYSSPTVVYAYEINLSAYHYLCENVRINKLKNVKAYHDNCENAEENIGDRVIMGYLKDTHKYLPKAIRILKEKGVIHYHDNIVNRLINKKIEKIRKIILKHCNKMKILNSRIVKSYAPNVSHMVIDIKIEK